VSIEPRDSELKPLAFSWSKPELANLSSHHR